MSTRYYLPLRHDALAKYVLKAVIMKNHPDMKYRESTEYEYVIKHDDMEYWWNISIKTATKVFLNKPYIVIWDKLNKECSVLEFSCPTDVNISNKVNEKNNVYGMLIRNMQILYLDYKFNMIPIIVGALGYIPKCLKGYVCDLGFDEKEAVKHMINMQNIVANGTVKICKTFLKFSDKV